MAPLMARNTNGGTVPISLRAPAEWVEWVDARAAEMGVNRSEAIVRLTQREGDAVTVAPAPPSQAVAVVVQAAAAPPAIPDDAEMILIQGPLSAIKYMRDFAVAKGCGVEHVFLPERDPGQDGYRLHTISPPGHPRANPLTMPRVVVHGWKVRDWIKLEAEADARGPQRNPMQPNRGPSRSAAEKEAWNSNSRGDGAPAAGSRVKGQPGAPGRGKR